MGSGQALRALRRIPHVAAMVCEILRCAQDDTGKLRMTKGAERLRERALACVYKDYGRSAASDGRDDRQLVAGLQARLKALQEADVLAVHVQVDEPADGTLVVAQTLADRREA